MKIDILSTAQVPGVYRLDPGDGGPPYVGSSIDIRARVIVHRSKLKSGQHSCPELTARWTGRLEPTILEVVVEASERLIREERWREKLQGIGARNPAAHGRIPDEIVREIRALEPKWGESTLANAARRLGLDAQALYNIRSGKTYKHVT